jgi:hypothetical protein
MMMHEISKAFDSIIGKKKETFRDKKLLELFEILFIMMAIIFQFFYFKKVKLKSNSQYSTTASSCHHIVLFGAISYLPSSAVVTSDGAKKATKFLENGKFFDKEESETK